LALKLGFAAAKRDLMSRALHYCINIQQHLKAVSSCDSLASILHDVVEHREANRRQARDTRPTIRTAYLPVYLCVNAQQCSSCHWIYSGQDWIEALAIEMPGYSVDGPRVLPLLDCTLCSTSPRSRHGSCFRIYSVQDLVETTAVEMLVYGVKKSRLPSSLEERSGHSLRGATTSLMAPSQPHIYLLLPSPLRGQSSSNARPPYYFFTDCILLAWPWFQRP